VTISSIDFGQAVTGTTETAAVTITNDGTADLVISGGIANDADGAFGAGATTLTIAPGDSATLDASFSPIGPSTSTGDLVLSSNEWR
jgi:hypothetical protein